MATHPLLPCCRRSGAKGQEILVIELPTGQHVTLQSAPPSVLIEDGNGNKIRMENGGITIQSATRLTINAPIVEVNGAELLVNASLAKFSAVVQADTVLSNNMPPGAGNVW